MGALFTFGPGVIFAFGSGILRGWVAGFAGVSVSDVPTADVRLSCGVAGGGRGAGGFNVMAVRPRAW